MSRGEKLEPGQTPPVRQESAALRVVLVSPEYAADAGGIGTNTNVTAHALARAGLSAAVVTPRAFDGASDDGVTVVRVAQPSTRFYTTRMLLALPTRRRIAAAARAFAPDVVQAPEWEAHAWWLARGGDIPVVTRLATPTYLLEELNQGGPQRATAFLRFLERDQARRSAAVFAPTRAIASRVERDWELPAPVRVIPNPIDLREVERLGAGDPGVALLTRPSLVFIGRLERRKGIHILGAALPRIMREHPELEVVVVGRDVEAVGGDAASEFRRHVAAFGDRVHVVGELSREQALAVVARATAVVLPSLWESFGYVCIEAMALGRAVVASRTGGFAEMVAEGRTGWLVEPGDPDALADALLDALSDTARLAAYGRAARSRADDWDADRVIRNIVELYDEVLQGRGRSFDARIYERGYRRHFRADDRRAPFHDLYEQKRQAVLTAVPATPRLRIVDVGGGYGRIAGPLSEHHDVVLCDISQEMLDEAAERWPAVELVRADARELPFEDSSFDVAVAVDLLTHLPDLEAGFAELARVVRPGGRVLADTTHHSPWWTPAYPRYVGLRPRRLVATMRAGGVLPEWRTLVTHHRPAEAREAIRAAGLVLDDMRPFGPRWSSKWHLWLARKP